jgi:hypothetical protein
VERHDADHEQRLAGVEQAHAGEERRVLFVLDQPSREDDEEKPERHP